MMNVNRHANIQVERIASISRLMEIGGKWKVLLQQSKAKEIFLTPEWITSWWKVFGTSGELYVLTIWADNDLIGVAPLYKVRRGIFRQLAFIGLPDHSDRVDFIYKEGYEEKCMRACLDYLNENVEWDVLKFNKLVSHTDSIRVLDTILKQKMWKYLCGQDGVYPYLELRDYTGYDDYMTKCFKSKHRGNLRREADRIRNVLKAVLTVRNEVDDKTISEMADVDVKRSARGRQGNSYFKKKENILFISELMQRFKKEDYIRLFTYEMQDRIAAYSLAFNYNDKILNYQMSYDDQYSKAGLGVHIILESIKYAIENKKSEYDLLLGEEDYKKRWSSNSRSSKYYFIFQNTYKSHLIYKYMKLYQHMRNVREVGKYYRRRLYK